MSKILCVIRVSTTHQEMESQHNDMISFLGSKGFKEEDIEWLEVAGASARKANKEYLQMLEGIKSTIINNQEINCCAFWCLDRLGRIESYINKMKEWFIKNQIQVYVKQPSLTLLKEDGSLDAGANIAWSVFAAMVAYQTEELMDKLKRGSDQKRKEGKYVGGWLALGFKKDPSGYVVEDREKMKDVKMIFEEYSTGKWSVNKLYKELHTRGYTYSEAHINGILRNEQYKPYVGELWDKVEAIFKDHNLGIKTKESKYTHLALKILKCPHCGHNFTAFSNFNYRCYSSTYNLKHIDKIECCSPTISIKVMDTILYDIAMMAYRWQLENIDEETIEELEHKKAICYQKINQCNNEMIRCSEKRSRAIELYAEGTISREKYNSLIGKATSDYITAQSEIASITNEIDKIEDNIRLSKNPNIESWFELSLNSTEEMPLDQIRELIHKYIKYAHVDKMEYKGNKATFILVEDFKGNQHKFIYNYRLGKAPIWTKKLMEVKEDGSTVPYCTDPNVSNRTEERRNWYLKGKEIFNLDLKQKRGATIKATPLYFLIIHRFS